MPSKPTSWNTGNSVSVYANGEWKLICSARYDGEYLTQTEIFTEAEILSTEKMTDQCSVKNFKIVQSEIVLCSDKNSAVTVTIHDMNGRMVKSLISNVTASDRIISIKSEMLPKGMYLCTLKQDGLAATKKLIVE